MPQRSFRVVIANPTQDLNLTQTFAHLCHGQWTGGWTPPATIPPGGSGSMQSESHGFMTGTEGYVKYDVFQTDQFGANTRLGMIYVYWDNPWMGITHFWYRHALGDVYPDCDFTIPTGHFFPPDTTSPVNFLFGFVAYLGGTVSGGEVTNITDLLGLGLAGIAGATVAPLIGPYGSGGPGEALIGYLAGMTGIAAHPELDLQVSDVPAPAGLTFGTGQEWPASLKLLTAASLTDWTGQWGNGKVNINISLGPLTVTGRHLSVTIQDGTVAPPLSLTETFLPGAGNLFENASSVLGYLLQSQATSPEEEAAYKQAAQTTIDAVTRADVAPSDTRAFFQTEIRKAGTRASGARTDAVGQVLATLFNPRRASSI